MDALFEAYLGIYEAFNEKGEFNREGDAPPPSNISPEELAKRQRQHDANTQRGAARRALTASQTPEEKAAAAARRRELAAKILGTQNEDIFYEANKAERYFNMSDKQKEQRRNIRWADNTEGISKGNTDIVTDKDSIKYVNQMRLARHKKRPSLDKERTRGTYPDTYLEKQREKREVDNAANTIKKFTREELEYILDVLVYEGYVDDYDGAMVIMEAMSDEWLEGILGE